MAKRLIKRKFGTRDEHFLFDDPAEAATIREAIVRGFYGERQKKNA